MTESCNTCNTCDPISKYIINELPEGAVIDENGVIINTENLSDIVRENAFRGSTFGDIGREISVDEADPFAIINPTEEKIQARESARKQDSFETDLETGLLPSNGDTLALIEKGLVSGDTPFAFVGEDPEYGLYKELIGILCCVEDQSLDRISMSTLTFFRDKISSLAGIAGIDYSSTENVILKILFSPYRVRDAISTITNSNIPITQILSSVNTGCLTRNRVERTVPIESGPTAIPLTDSYVRIFATETDFRRLAGVVKGFTCSNNPLDPRLSNITNAYDSSQNKFNNPQRGINDTISCVGRLVSSVTQLLAVISDFGQGGQSEHLSQISRLTNVTNALNQFIIALKSCSGDTSGLQIPNFNQVLSLGREIENKTKFIGKYSNELQNVNTLAQQNLLFGDVTKMLSAITEKTQSLVPKLSEMLSLLGDFSVPNAPEEFIQNRDPGSMLGNFLSGIVLGQAIPTQKQSNNPTLRAPSYIGKALFGEAAFGLPAIDQRFARRVAMFQDASGGVASSAFGMQNETTGSRNITSAVTSILAGSGTLSGQAVQAINTIATDVSSLLGVNINTTIDLRRSDNAIPLMIGMAARISGDTYSPFPSSVFTEGWKMASYARTRLEKTNPRIFTEET